MSREIRLQLGEEAADLDRLDVLAGYLREELLQLDVASVTALPAGPAPPGSRGLDLAAVGGLIVTLTQALPLATVISTIRHWLSRGGSGDSGPVRRIRLEIDGDMLELSSATASQQDQVINLFADRHRA